MTVDPLVAVGGVIVALLGALGISRANSKTNTENTKDKLERDHLLSRFKQHDELQAKHDKLTEKYMEQRFLTNEFQLQVRLLNEQVERLTQATIQVRPDLKDELTKDTSFGGLEDTPRPKPSIRSRR